METIKSFFLGVWDLLPPISVFDIIDILIMAFIIYKIMMLIRRTSSASVAKGILILIVAVGVSQIAQLSTVNFLLTKVVEWGVLALVILFQPEIRRFLEQMGRSGLGSLFSTVKMDIDDLENAIAQTVEAYTALSKSKTGALMVFERQNILNEAIKTGTHLDSAIHSELLKNIFWNKAPMHDGAVIVRNGRIVGAGCMLPLSGNVNLSRDLGMRHRAGIGISEQSDAVAAIVSEETGSISVAVGGQLKRHLAPATLDKLLRNELLPGETEGEGKKFKLPSLAELGDLIRGRKGGKGDGENEKKD